MFKAIAIAIIIIIIPMMIVMTLYSSVIKRDRKGKIALLIGDTYI